MVRSNILLVDDEQNNRKTIIRLFEDYNIEFTQACHGQEALEKLNESKFDLILLDIKMPVMGGIEFLTQLRNTSLNPTPPVCVMTAFGNAKTRRQSIYLGADDFIDKPLDPIELETRVASMLRIGHYQQELNKVNGALEKLVSERTQQLQSTLDKLKETKQQHIQAYREMISRIALMTDFQHSEKHPTPTKLGLCTAALGWIYGLPNDATDNLCLSSQVYRIGLLALPEAKRQEHADSLSEYSVLGSGLFDQSDIPLLKQAHDICRFHLENYDGSGSPDAVSGDDIPIEARLFRAAHIMVNTIEQHPEDTLYYVKGTLRELSGNMLDPDIVRMVLESEHTLNELIKQLR